jgi:6-phosphogluconolactonase
MSVRVFDSTEALSEEAANHILQLLGTVEGPFHLVLSGGSTPKKLYTILASPLFRDSIPWNRIHFWWGDERFVPPADPDSNEGMARAAMLDHVPVPASNIHSMFREGTAEQAANSYQNEVRELVPNGAFNLMLLGLGPDAHTASLFPGDPSIHETEKWVVASTGAAGVKHRITMTPPLINRSDVVLFLVAGQDKAEPLAHVLGDTYDPDRFPAQIVARNAPSVLWYIDAVAGTAL